MSRQIIINGRIYSRKSDIERFQIPLEELDDLKMIDIPAHSHVEILDLPEPEGCIEFEHYALNSGEEREEDNLCVYGGAVFKIPLTEAVLAASRLQRAFPAFHRDSIGLMHNPEIRITNEDDEVKVHLFMHIDFNRAPKTLVRDAVRPFEEGYLRMMRPSVHIFICHSTEDKPAARELAVALKTLGAEVWLDEWEIKVGDSIVAKINTALGTVSHLIVLLSQSSVNKPWVAKEFSSALMRQLSDNSVKVLPLRLDNCAIPTILADIKYADARTGMPTAVLELRDSLFS